MRAGRRGKGRALTSALVCALLVGILAVGGAAVYSASASSTATGAVVQSTTLPIATTTDAMNSSGGTITATTALTTIVTTAVTNATSTTSRTATQFTSPGVNDVVQSCASRGNPDQTVSCVLPSPVTSGHLLVVEIAEVPEAQIQTVGLYGDSNVTEAQISNSSTPQVASLSDSLGDNFTLIGSAPQAGSTYILYFFVVNITSSATDQVTLSGVGNYPFLLVHELQNVGRAVAFSTGAGNSTSPSISPYVAPSGSFVLAAVFVLNDRGTMAANVTAGSGNTLLDTTYGIAEEYNSGAGLVTSPFVMTGSIPWGEVSIAFV
jgi:hypothetical protein